MSIHEARKDKLSVSKVDKGYVERSMLSKYVQESRFVDVLFDPVNLSRCSDGNQTPRKSLEIRKRLWVDKWAIKDSPRFRG